MTFFWLSLTFLIATILGILRVHRFAWSAARGDWQTVRSLGRLLVIRWRWKALARQLDLVLRDRTPVSVFAGTNTKETVRKVGTPTIRLTADRYGVIVTMRTVPGVGLEEVQKASCHLADAWRSVRVAVTQPKPGRIRIRAVRLDPLTLPTTMATLPDKPKSLDLVPVGMDEYGEAVDLRLNGISGIGVYGLPGYGKTSFLHGLIVRLSAFDCVHFVVLDGKTDAAEHGDYGDLADRITVLSGDDLDEANRILEALVAHRKDRARNINAELGVKNIWHVGPFRAWPLLIVIVDEAHTYMSKVMDGGDKELRARNAKAAQNIMHIEDLVKKGRAVGIITVVATQKGTGDAIPTQIRDVLTISLCYAVKTIESAIAALGEDIRQWPTESPVGLQDPVYIGVATMKVLGRPGFTRVRMPFVPEQLVTQAAMDTRELVASSHGELPRVATSAEITAG